jgi:hypothetical protein
MFTERETSVAIERFFENYKKWTISSNEFGVHEKEIMKIFKVDGLLPNAWWAKAAIYITDKNSELPKSWDKRLGRCDL